MVQNEHLKLQSSKYCYECGNSISMKAEICPRCGVRQPSAYPHKSKTTAALLALLLGGIGVHRFYLGQTWIGLIYLVFCWTFVPALIAFVESLFLLSMSEQRFQDLFGNHKVA